MPAMLNRMLCSFTLIRGDQHELLRKDKTCLAQDELILQEQYYHRIPAAWATGTMFSEAEARR